MGVSLLKMILLLKVVFVFLLVLVSVAFFTLLERSVLGYSHVRLGPNKIFMMGVFQPFTDAIKLFTKEDMKFRDLNLSFYFFSPLFFIFMSVFVWSLLPFWGVVFFSKYSLVLLVCLFGSGVYFLLYSGWSGSSKFSLLGSCRSSSQSISYEVVMIFSILMLMYMWFSMGFLEHFFMSYGMSGVFSLFIIFICWVFSCLAESNRSPFDFSEGESELVSGFNTEYFGGVFSFIFIGEYSFILFLSFLSSVFFFGYMLSFLAFCFISYVYLWARCTYARLRYDFLMDMSWKSLVFLSVCNFFFYYVVF